MNLAARVLAGLLAGFLLGLAIAGSTSPAAAAVLGLLAPVGTIFVNLIRMTVVPLVVSLLIASIGSLGGAAGIGRTGVRAGVLAIVLLLAAAIGSAVVAGPVLNRLVVDRSSALALGVSQSTPAPASASGAAQWFVDLVPQNVFKAAADGAMLPLILFAVVFGFALARVADPGRASVLRAVQAVADSMQRLVGWILELAPLGVFALAVPLAARLGLSAAGAVAAYIVLVVVLTAVAVALLLYPLGVARMGASGFAAYCAPSQAIALASRSSLASLPVMIESAERAALPPEAARFVLPLALSVFHFGAAVAQTVGALFLARLFGVPLGPAQMASLIVAVVFASFAVPGIPGGSIIAMVPVLAAAHVPLEGIGILLAVDTIPDMFRTAANVTGALALAAVVGDRGSHARV